jgi:beta-lactamase regulating signal transducer with metallopeptidase domain/biopolymer transport protein ExbD
MPSFLYLALSNAVLATLLAALVAVVTRFCRRPSVRHALWLLVLLKLITPPIVPLAVTWPRSEENEPRAEAIFPSEPEPSEPIPSLPESALPIGAATVRERPSQAEPPLPLPDGRGSAFLPALTWVWLGGAVAWWIVAAVRLRKFRRLLRQALQADAGVQEQGRRIAATLGLRHCPPILFVAAPLSPMLWALGFSPRLLVPAKLWQKLASEQQDTLLAHELAHLRRGDHWVRRLELLVLGLFWWHPVVWWAQRRLQDAEEECCDALVVAILPDAAPAYASALVETVAFLSQSRPAALVGASGAGQVPLLKRRLTMILTESSSRKPSRIGFWIVLGMGALLLPLAPQAARTEALEEPQGEETKSEPFSLDFGFPLVRLADNPRANQVENCTSCHTALMPKFDFHGKPQSWREAHDEIVRLMDELRRRQAEFNKATNQLSADTKPDRSKEIEKLQDEIELLKVRVRLKEAHLAAAQAPLKEYRKRLAGYSDVNRRQPGTIQTDVILETQIAITTHEGQLKIHEAELQEVLVRLKQAERRLARLQPTKNQYELAPPKMSWNVTWAEALFDQRTHDIGSVPHGTIVERRFAMTNRGQRPVHIANIRTSTACLEATASGHELAPGASASIQAKLDTSRFVGDKTFKISVQFDKPDRQEVVLDIHANSQAGVPAKPQSPERLQELEKKLDELRKEMDKLRRETRPDKPRESEQEHKGKVERQIIHVIVRMEDSKPVIQVENQAIDLDSLATQLRRYVKATKKPEILLESNSDVPHRIIIGVQDAAREAGMEKVNLAVLEKGKH